jgi:hypothetical protein
MKALVHGSLLVLLAMAQPAIAQQSQSFDGYTIHYNAINTSQLTPQIAQAYGIQRSSSRALLNITVLREQAAGQPAPSHARVEVSARNLTGQLRDIEMREISEADEAIYYIGVFRVNNMETFDFTVSVVPEGEAAPLEVKFRQQFYTE